MLHKQNSCHHIGSSCLQIFLVIFLVYLTRGGSKLPDFVFVKLVSQEGDTILGDHGDQVDQPDNEVAEAGHQTNQTNDQSDDVLALGKADDAVNTTDNVTQENLDQDLNDLGQLVVHLGNGLVHV